MEGKTMFMITVTSLKRNESVVLVRPTKSMVKKDFAAFRSLWGDDDQLGWALYGPDGYMSDSGGLPQICLPPESDCHSRYDVAFHPRYYRT